MFDFLHAGLFVTLLMQTETTFNFREFFTFEVRVQSAYEVLNASTAVVSSLSTTY